MDQERKPAKKIVLVENQQEREVDINMLAMFKDDTEHQLVHIFEDDNTVKYKVLQKLNG